MHGAELGVLVTRTHAPDGGRSYYLDTRLRYMFAGRVHSQTEDRQGYSTFESPLAGNCRHMLRRRPHAATMAPRKAQTSPSRIITGYRGLVNPSSGKPHGDNLIEFAVLLSAAWVLSGSCPDAAACL